MGALSGQQEGGSRREQEGDENLASCCWEFQGPGGAGARERGRDGGSRRRKDGAGGRGRREGESVRCLKEEADMLLQPKTPPPPPSGAIFRGRRVGLAERKNSR
eukprot:764910-Hanusia_phi.AAC.2